MKKLSAMFYFSVLWRGLRQLLAKFFGLFGYRRGGKFGRCLWGLFAVSATVIMVVVALAMLYCVGDELYRQYVRVYRCFDTECYNSQCLAPDIYFHNNGDRRGYIFNSETREKTLEHVEWIAMQDEKDSLVCFSNGDKRGYFNKYTGQEVLPPKYDHAWVFSDGLASVVENGRFKFIDVAGATVIDMAMPYSPVMGDWVFHNGYCITSTTDGQLYGLMDKKGSTALPKEYDLIVLDDEHGYWLLTKGEEQGVLDSQLNVVIPLTECSVYLGETINLTMPDHSIRSYDYEGRFLGDHYITLVRVLEYEKDEIVNEGTQESADSEEATEVCQDSYHPKATARLRAYVAGDGYEGLMTADGKRVTMPIYTDIEAIGYDLYLCSIGFGAKTIVNGKGETVK